MRKRPTKDEDDIDLSALLGKPKGFRVSCMGPDDGPCVYNIFLFGAIESAEQFVPAIEALQVAEEDDTVIVHISTPGGNIDATDTFLFALDNARAKRIIFQATGGVHSAGSVILLAAPEIYFSDNFSSLIHNGSMGWGGKTSDFASASKFILDQDRKMMFKVYRHFLSDEEIEDVLAGKDIWLDREGFLARLQKRNDIYEAAKNSQE